MVLGARQRCSKWSSPHCQCRPQVNTAKFDTGMSLLQRSLGRVRHPLPSALQTAGKSIEIMQGLCFKERNEILEFFKAKKGRERNRFIVLVGYSTRCRTKLASLLSNVIIGILFSFSFFLLLSLPPFFPPSFLPSSPPPSSSSFSSSTSFSFYGNNPPTPILLQVILSFWAWD